MDILNNKQKIIIIMIVIFMLSFIGYHIIQKMNNQDYIDLEIEESNIIENDIKENNTIEEEQEIIVHVTGAVKMQGIVILKSGARILDVIEEAGGATEEADLSKINLAYVVQDGQKIYVPNINDEKLVEFATEEAGENIIEDNSQTSKRSKVNINTAAQTELETLNGIGPSTALKIINYRNENGNFKNIEDIKNVPGIGDAKYEAIKNEICI